MVRNKIKSTSGASLALALLFFLACAVVGSVILAAATASSGRIADLRDENHTYEEQSYYTVTSAAKLLKSEIEGEIYSRNAIPKGVDAATYGYNQKPSGKLATLIQEHADTIFENNQESPVITDPSEENFTVKANNYENVKAEFSMDVSYNITIVLSEGGYECTLEVPAAISLNKEPSARVTDDGTSFEQTTTTLTWTDGTITR